MGAYSAGTFSSSWSQSGRKTLLNSHLYRIHCTHFHVTYLKTQVFSWRVWFRPRSERSRIDPECRRTLFGTFCELTWCFFGSSLGGRELRRSSRGLPSWIFWNARYGFPSTWTFSGGFRRDGTGTSTFCGASGICFVSRRLGLQNLEDHTKFTAWPERALGTCYERGYACACALEEASGPTWY